MKMTKKIKIGGVPVLFTGNAATTYRYKQIFKRDLLKTFMERGDDMDLDMITELAFIMKCQAEGYDSAKFNSTTFENYVDWLNTMDFMALMGAAPEILSVWADTSKTAVKAKKK